MVTKNKKPEAAFQAKCMNWLKNTYGRHFWCVKIWGNPYMKPGVPDVLCCIRGHFIGLEFKDPDKKPRIGHRQAEQILEIQAAGGRARIVASWEDLFEAIEGIEPVQLGMNKREKSNG
jgi:hypothetical protein